MTAPRHDHDATSRWHFVAIFMIALVVRAGIGVMANGRGEMEGLAAGYETGAYAMAAGYGFIRPVGGSEAPGQVDLARLVADLARRGERLTPRNAPPITPALWRPATLHPPGYSAFLYLIYLVIGRPVSVWARVIQAVLDAAACLLVVQIGKRFGGRFVGLFAGYGTALFLPLAYTVTSRVADGLTPQFVVLGFWVFLKALETGRYAWWAGCGAVMAALWMLRPDYAVLPPFLLLGAALGRPGFRRHLRGGALLLLTTAVLVLPWPLRNLRAIGEFLPGTTGVGMQILEGIGMFSNPYRIPMSDGWYYAEAKRAGFESAEDPGASRIFLERYRAIAKEQPLMIARNMLLQLGMGLLPPYHWGYANPHYKGHSYYDYHDREGVGPLGALRRHPVEILLAQWDRLLFLPVSLLLLAGCVACVVRAPRAWRTVFLLLLPFEYVVLVHLPLNMTVRMMVPGVFAQMIALGCAIELLRRRPALGLAPTP